MSALAQADMDISECPLVPIKLQIGVGRGDTCPGHFHHPAVDLDPIAIRVEKVEGVAPATTDKLLAALRTVHVGATYDFDAARTHMFERHKPILSRVDLEGDVIDTGALADTGIGRCDAGLCCILYR